MSIRIIIVEGSRTARAQIRAATHSEMEVVAEYGQFPGLTELRSWRADVICLGERAVRNLVRQGGWLALGDTKLICLVSAATTPAVDFALRAGAFGCVLGATIPLEIAKAIESVAAGGHFASPMIVSVVAENYRHWAFREERPADVLCVSKEPSVNCRKQSKSQLKRVGRLESEKQTHTMNTIEKGPNGLYLTFSGEQTLDELQRLRRELERTLEGVCEPFGLIADMRNIAPMPPRQRDFLLQTRKTLRAKGMTRSAIVLMNPVLTARWRLTAGNAGVGAWERYIDATDNLDWRNMANDWVCSGVEPAAP
jgi:DNA-binding NarL/FixJ family response regulator